MQRVSPEMRGIIRGHDTGGYLVMSFLYVSDWIAPFNFFIRFTDNGMISQNPM